MSRSSATSTRRWGRATPLPSTAIGCGALVRDRHGGLLLGGDRNGRHPRVAARGRRPPPEPREPDRRPAPVMPDDALFHDPVHDGATDPTVIRHRETGEWWMFYTQRRASVDEPGVAWVHGSRIGVARSADACGWRMPARSTACDSATGPETHWAPEVIDDGERYRMYLTVIDGIPDRWEGHARRIVEYLSDDLEHWRPVGEIPLSSDRVIDACVARSPDGRWRLWYKDEADGSTTWVAVSDDLSTWSVEGRADRRASARGSQRVRARGVVVDARRRVARHGRAPLGRRDQVDATGWRRRRDPRRVRASGRRRDVRQARRRGRRGRSATLYYFTHPHWDGSELGSERRAAARLSAVFSARLGVVDGRLFCDRHAGDRKPQLTGHSVSG